MTRRRAEEFKHTKTANHDFFLFSAGLFTKRTKQRASEEDARREKIDNVSHPSLLVVVPLGAGNSSRHLEKIRFNE